MRRLDPNLPSIGQAELEILSHIHAHHPLTVRQVADHLAQTRGIVRTTVLNVMARLVRKGYLTRKRAGGGGGGGGGVFVYSPRVEKPQVLRSLVRSFVKDSLGGSVSPFVAFLLEDATVSPEELAQLRQLVDQLDQKPKSP